MWSDIVRKCLHENTSHRHRRSGKINTSCRMMVYSMSKNFPRPGFRYGKHIGDQANLPLACSILRRISSLSSRGPSLTRSIAAFRSLLDSHPWQALDRRSTSSSFSSRRLSTSSTFNPSYRVRIDSLNGVGLVTPTTKFGLQNASQVV